MAQATDFRLRPFDSTRVEASGKFVGRSVYWKLYYIENAFRVIINSVLSVQIGPDWWDTAVDEKIRKDAERFKRDYLSRPWHAAPGSHGIYYVHLRDLVEIMRANSNLFLLIIPEIDQWMARIEQLRLPRNIVGHMNYPSHIDRQRINVIYADCRELVEWLRSSGRVSFQVP